MCEPTTIAMVGLALSGATAVVGMQNAKNQAAYTQRVAQNNAIEADRAATKATDKGEQDAMMVRRQAAQAKGGQRAALAARGLDLNSGTAEQLQAQTDFFGEQDQATVRENAREQARGFRAQGSNYSAQAANSSPGEAGFVSLLGGASSVADKWHVYSRGSANQPRAVA